MPSDASFDEFAQHLSRLEINSSQNDEPYANLATLAIHADDKLGKELSDVAPAMHLSTTYRYPDEGVLEPILSGAELANTGPIYSRVASTGSNRYEQILSSVLQRNQDDGPCYALVYASGVAAFHGVLTEYLPNTIVMPHGSYHGLHGAVHLHQEISRNVLKKVILSHPFDSPESWKDIKLSKGDLVLIETPINPTGEIVNLRFIADLAHAQGALVVVDSTLAPPPIQDPFASGADIVLHSGSKYFGGHSDMLCGIVAVKEQSRYRGLVSKRLLLGATIGNLEIWLGIRSIRTLNMRVRQQSQNAEKIVRWLVSSLANGDKSVSKVVKEIKHSIAQEAVRGESDVEWMKKQMPGGYSPVFSLIMKTQEYARALPRKLKLFHHATSLGGVESLVEWRRMTDGGADPSLVRVSIGVEEWEDLRNDFAQAFKGLDSDAAK